MIVEIFLKSFSNAKFFKVGFKFRDSLSLLTTKLGETTPHYIRCVKPNQNKSVFQFDSKK